DFIPKLGAAPDLVRHVAGLDAPGLIDQVFEVGESFVVVEVLSREKPDLSKLGDAKRDELRERLILRKQSDQIQAFIDGLKESATVETNEALVSAGFGSSAPRTTGPPGSRSRWGGPPDHDEARPSGPRNTGPGSR